MLRSPERLLIGLDLESIHVANVVKTRSRGAVAVAAHNSNTGGRRVCPPDLVVDYLDAGWPFARPAEANAELPVDSDAVLTLAVSLEPRL